MNAITKTAEGEGLKEDASNYDEKAYKKPSVTVDVCICRYHEKAVQVLLIKRKNPPFRNMWAIPGGFLKIEDEESLEATAARELREETGLKRIYTEQLKTYGDPKRDPRMRVVTVAYFALVPQDFLEKQTVVAADDAKEAEWFPLLSLPKLAFDHKEILEDLVERLAGKISYMPIAFNLVNKKFTLRELQDVYEYLLEKEILGPNFRRKIMSMYWLEKLDEVKVSETGGRPATLYTFKATYQTGF